MIVKQCTKLLPYDTSLYTVYAVFYDVSEGIKDIDMRNDHISKEMKIYLNEDGTVHASNEVIKNFVTAIQGTSLLLCSDATEASTSVLHAIGDILAKDDAEPLVIEPRNDIATPFWEVALQYNHTVSAVGHGGFGGGLTSPASYDTLKGIMSKQTYDNNVLHSCIDDRGMDRLWTPWSSVK